MRFSALLIIGSSCALPLASCSHDSNTLTVSPPLPPAEEPSDEAAGAYIADAGANTPEGSRSEDDKSKDSKPKSDEPGATTP